MKKLSILFLLLASTFANAQEHKGFGVSLRTGVSNARMEYISGTIIESNFEVPTLGGSIFYDFPKTSKLDIRLQLSYLDKSWKYQRQYFYSSLPEWVINEFPQRRIGIVRESNNFISPEILFKYYLSKRSFRPFIGAGFRIDIYLKTKETFKDIDENVISEISQRYSNIVRRGLIPSLTTTLGLEYKKVELYFEFNPALATITKPQGYFDIYKQPTQTLSVVAGYRF